MSEKDNEKGKETYIIEFQEDDTSIVNSFKLNNVSKGTFDKINCKKTCDNIEIEKNNNNIIIKNFFSNDMIVEDEWRYCVNIERNKYPNIQQNTQKSNFNNSKYGDKEIPENMMSIVLILESPHRDEYRMEGTKYIPIAPAQGKTGVRINESIGLILNEIISNPKYKISLCVGHYRLIICNPVQYQTSLYYFHESKDLKTLRNNVWKEIFKQENIKKSFNERLASYAPEVIINACTSDCKSNVAQFIEKNFKETKYIETYHPSNWTNFIIK